MGEIFAYVFLPLWPQASDITLNYLAYQYLLLNELMWSILTLVQNAFIPTMPHDDSPEIMQALPVESWYGE